MNASEKDRETWPAEINGLILAGGRSARMGRDKSMLHIHDQPQRIHIHNLLKRFCRTVCLSCKSEKEVPRELNPIADRYDLESPLNGILSAFSVDPVIAWLAVAVDMPLVDEATIAFLIGHRDPQKIATCFRDSDGRKPEPLLTLWEPAAYPLLRSFHMEGNISPRDFLMRNDITLIDAPDAAALTNINSEEDLLRLSRTRR